MIPYQNKIVSELLNKIMNKVQKVQNVQNLPDMWNSGKSLAADDPEQTVAVTGAEGGGPSPGCRLDRPRLSRPWEGTPVDFEARLKYSQPHHQHPLIWAQPPWGPHSLKGDLLISKNLAREKAIRSDFSPLFWQDLTHPGAGFLNLKKLL